VVEDDVPGEHENTRSVYNVDIYKKGRSEQRKGMGTATRQTSFLAVLQKLRGFGLRRKRF
jgi:hypothetical protein